MTTRPLILACASCALFLWSAACSDNPVANNAQPSADASTDAPSTDGSPDQRVDGAADLTVDTPQDIPQTPDASGDQGEDVAPDLTDASTDALLDEEADQPPEPQAQGGDTCDQALDVSAGGVWGAQSTLRAQDDYDSLPFDDGCPAGRGTGRDLTYVLRAPISTASYNITVEPVEPNFDPMIYLRTDCDQSVCLDGTVLNGPGQPERITGLRLERSDVVFVIVDGEALSNGSFTLTVEKMP